MNDRTELPVVIEVGAAEQSITVVGEMPLLNTASAMGQVIDSRLVQDVPVPHGNPMFLISLASGVSFNTGPETRSPV